MFIPIGGIFVFGSNRTQQGAILNLVVGFINLTLGGVALFFGLYNNVLWLRIVGGIIVSIGLLMVILSLLGLRRQRKQREQHNDDTAHNPNP